MQSFKVFCAARIRRCIQDIALGDSDDNLTNYFQLFLDLHFNIYTTRSNTLSSLTLYSSYSIHSNTNRRMNRMRENFSSYQYGYTFPKCHLSTFPPSHNDKHPPSTYYFNFNPSYKPYPPKKNPTPIRVILYVNIRYI